MCTRQDGFHEKKDRLPAHRYWLSRRAFQVCRLLKALHNQEHRATLVAETAEHVHIILVIRIEFYWDSEAHCELQSNKKEKEPKNHTETIGNASWMLKLKKQVTPGDWR